jgi:TPR repeat protein
MKFLAAILFVLLIAPGTAMAATFDEGQAAFDRNDYDSALKIWRDLAAQGDAEAEDKVGWMYESGYGVKQDYSEAMKWYRIAAKQGNSEADVNISELYRDGKGVAQDAAEAAKWVRKAADQGDPAAELALGEMYEHGEGVTRDYAEALFWISVTAKSGMDSAVADKAAESFSPHLTPEQIATVKKRIAEWQPTSVAPQKAKQ